MQIDEIKRNKIFTSISFSSSFYKVFVLISLINSKFLVRRKYETKIEGIKCRGKIRVDSLRNITAVIKAYFYE